MRGNTSFFIIFNWFYYSYLMCSFQIFFFFLYITVLSHGDFPHGKFGLFSLGKASCNRLELSNMQAPNSDMDYRIFKVHTCFNACTCTRWCMDTVREFALKVDCATNKQKISCHTGESIEPAPAACRSDTIATKLHPHP